LARRSTNSIIGKFNHSHLESKSGFPLVSEEITLDEREIAEIENQFPFLTIHFFRVIGKQKLQIGTTRAAE
jgi:hypothetical protein